MRKQLEILGACVQVCDSREGEDSRKKQSPTETEGAILL